EWFAQQQPKRPAPLPGLGGGFPGLPKDMPERADIGLPPLEFGNLGTGSPPPPVSATPIAGESPPATPPAKSDEPKSDATSPEVPNNPDAKSSESSPPPTADSAKPVIEKSNQDKPNEP